MVLFVKCPNGHGLKMDEAFSGSRRPCPKCQAVVAVPTRPRQRPLSDSSVLGILGDYDPQESVVVQPAAQLEPREVKKCRHCRAEMPPASSICPDCKKYQI